MSSAAVSPLPVPPNALELIEEGSASGVSSPCSTWGFGEGFRSLPESADILSTIESESKPVSIDAQQALVQPVKTAKVATTIKWDSWFINQNLGVWFGMESGFVLTPDFSTLSIF